MTNIERKYVSNAVLQDANITIRLMELHQRALHQGSVKVKGLTRFNRHDKKGKE